MSGKRPLDEQNPHWEKTYALTPEMFGDAPSDPAVKAVELFGRAGVHEILELGAGQGRDTLYFARNGLQVHALDYSHTGLDAIQEKALAQPFASRIAVTRHDVREPLPFTDNSLEGCYAHMLFCMALTTVELEFLAGEIRRVLKPGGLCLYSVRHTADPQYGTGIHRGEDLYEVGGFIVHFFSRDKVTHLAQGYELLEVAEFEEGLLPRKLFRVTMRKR